MRSNLLYGGAWALAGMIAAVVAGTAALLGTAALVPVVAVFGAAGLMAAAGAAWLFGRPAVRRFGAPRALWPYVAVVVLLGACLGAATVFHPFPVPPVAAAPPGVSHWDLPTGSRIAYVKIPASGRARPTPVIFLHGGPGTPGEGVPEGGRELAAAGFDVYAYDQVGAGRSTRLADVTGYTVGRHVADLDAIRRAIHAEKVILVGRSWGGTLSAAYMAAHPGNVAKAVLTSPGAIWEPAFPGGPGGPWDRLAPAQAELADELTSTPRFLAQALLLQVNPAAAHALVPDSEADAYFRELLLTAKDATGCPGSAPAPVHDNRPGFYSNQMTSADAAAVPDPRPRLRAVHVPTLVVRGECDYLKWAVTYDYRRTLPESTLVYVRGAGHSIANGRPDLYRDLLLAFLLDRPLPLPPVTSADEPA
ncbi:alpha/beta hydrolase [Microtetraspora fusca]|uniref:alpha/beta hydrolase n=1 Tax=Microtetraspora fusca TaxID=1997 RepID=UPI000831A911|nr:alpha/beta hydrolase [Microtetraspora fusca]